MNLKKIMLVSGLLSLYLTQGIFAGDEDLQSLILASRKTWSLSKINPNEVREMLEVKKNVAMPEIHIEKLESCAVSNETTEVVLHIKAPTRLPISLKELQATLQIQDHIQTLPLSDQTEVILPGESKRIFLSFHVPDATGNHPISICVNLQDTKLYSKEAMLRILKDTNDEEKDTSEQYILGLEKQLTNQATQENLAMIARMKEMIAKFENITVDSESEKSKGKKVDLQNIEQENESKTLKEESDVNALQASKESGMEDHLNEIGDAAMSNAVPEVHIEKLATSAVSDETTEVILHVKAPENLPISLQELEAIFQIQDQMQKIPLSEREEIILPGKSKKIVLPFRIPNILGKYPASVFTTFQGKKLYSKEGILHVTKGINEEAGPSASVLGKWLANQEKIKLDLKSDAQKNEFEISKKKSTRGTVQLRSKEKYPYEISEMTPEVHIEKLATSAVSDETTEVILHVKAPENLPVSLQELKATFQIQDQVQRIPLSKREEIILPGRSKKIALSFHIPNILGKYPVSIFVTFQGKKLCSKEGILHVTKEINKEAGPSGSVLGKWLANQEKIKLDLKSAAQKDQFEISKKKSTRGTVQLRSKEKYPYEASDMTPQVHIEKLESCAVSDETTEVILHVKAPENLPVSLQELKATFQIQDQVQRIPLSKREEIILPGRSKKIALPFHIPNILGKYPVSIFVTFQGEKLYSKEFVLQVVKKVNEEIDLYNSTLKKRLVNQEERKLALKSSGRKNESKISRVEPGKSVVKMPKELHVKESHPNIIIEEPYLRSENLRKEISMFGMAGASRSSYQRVPFHKQEKVHESGKSFYLFSIPKGTYKMAFKSEDRQASKFDIEVIAPKLVWSSTGDYSDRGFDFSAVYAQASLRLQGVWGTITLPFYEENTVEGNITLPKYLTQFEIDLKNGIYQDSFGNYLTRITELNCEDTYQVYLVVDHLSSSTDCSLHFTIKGHNEFM